MALIIYIEGNIAAGKTTLMLKLMNVLDTSKCLIVYEPIHEWPSLKLFYKDRKLYSLQLQTEILESFHRREVDCSPDYETYIMERSLRSSLEVFSSLNCSESELITLKRMRANMGRENVHPSFVRQVYIYLRTSSEKCYQNLSVRRKAVDGYIDLDYLKMLEEKHDRVFMTPSSNTYIIDGNRTATEVFEEAYDKISEIINASLTKF